MKSQKASRVSSQILLSSLSLFSLVSCGQSLQSSSLNVTNGIQKKPERFNAVISQDGCTGTFVSPTTIITAAHCADHGFTYNGIRTISFQSMPEALQKPWSFAIDIRLLVFPEAVAPAWIAISSKEVKGDESVVFAGYGTFDLKNGRNDGQFRYGTGQLLGFEADKHLLLSHGTDLASIEGTEGTNSGVGPGDSGGPLLHDGMLIGVASAVSGIGDDRHKSLHVNLSHPEIMAFLQDAVKSGIDIRFDQAGTIPYEECFDVDAKKEKNDVTFTVPHRQLTTVTGDWTICKDCERTTGEGFQTGRFKDYRPQFANLPAGALLLENKKGAPSAQQSQGTESPLAWSKEALSFDELIFATTLGIHDQGSFSDNEGSLKVCFL